MLGGSIGEGLSLYALFVWFPGQLLGNSVKICWTRWTTHLMTQQAIEMVINHPSQ